jgi:RNA polymerase subunit RPABC4/transcription elongation factor Spt4
MNKFKESKEKYFELKKLYDENKIGKEEFKKKLRELVVKDSNGLLWSIGEKSGKWYYLENNKWIEGEPEELKMIECSQCHFLNPPGAKICGKCGNFLEKKELRCPNCKSIISSGYNYCPYCGYQIGKKEISGLKKREIISLNLKSFFIFFGGIGIFLGIIFGAYYGVTQTYSFPINKLPQAFQNIRGGLKGGMLFGIGGAIFGFLVTGIIGWLLSLLYNFISFLFGGTVFITKDY